MSVQISSFKDETFALYCPIHIMHGNSGDSKVIVQQRSSALSKLGTTQQIKQTNKNQQHKNYQLDGFLPVAEVAAVLRTARAGAARRELRRRSCGCCCCFPGGAHGKCRPSAGCGSGRSSAKKKRQNIDV